MTQLPGVDKSVLVCIYQRNSITLWNMNTRRENVYFHFHLPRVVNFKLVQSAHICYFCEYQC